jgi:hypothetical protein
MRLREIVRQHHYIKVAARHALIGAPAGSGSTSGRDGRR